MIFEKKNKSNRISDESNESSIELKSIEVKFLNDLKTDVMTIFGTV